VSSPQRGEVRWGELEVVTVLGERHEREFVIHAMGMRTRYVRLPPGGEHDEA